MTDTDLEAYKGLSPRSVLKAAEQVKRAKYLKACLEQRCTFMPLAYFVHGMVGVKACAFEKRISVVLMTR